MGRSRAVLFMLPLISLLAIVLKVTTHYEVSEECLMVYGRGGVPAVVLSPKCSHLVRSFANQTKNCHFTSHQGRMKEKVDYITCNLNMELPLVGDRGLEHFSIGIVALFEGRDGGEISEVASNLLLEYLWSHSLFVSYQAKLPGNDAKALRYLLKRTGGILPFKPNESRHMRSIKEVLLRTIWDINSYALTIENRRRSLSSSMASVGVLFEGQIMAVNVGRPKAILCSEKIDVQKGGATPYIYAKELIEDREIDKEQDRLIAERAYEWSHWPTALSTWPRSIGRTFWKRSGFLSKIDISDWQPITGEDRYLVIAGHNIMKELSPIEVCDVLFHPDRICNSANLTRGTSSGECIALMAFVRGCLRSVSNIVVPLSTIKSENPIFSS